MRFGVAIQPALTPLAAFALPVLMFALGSGGAWFFDDGGGDSWQYLNYFVNYLDVDGDTKYQLAFNYKGSRIGWIALGIALFSVVPPVAAQIALTLVVFAGCCFALYLILLETTNRKVALLVLALAAAYPGYHGSGMTAGMWNYHAGFANMFFLFGVYATLRISAKRDFWLWSLASGASFATALTTTFALLPAGPAVLVLGALSLWRRPDMPWLRAGLCILLGFASGVLILAVISKLMGGPFDFISSQITFILRAQEDNPWAAPLSYWVPRAEEWGFLASSILIALIGVAAFPFVGRDKPHEQRVGLLVLLSLAPLIMLGCILGGKNGVMILEIPYTSYHLVGPAFLALGAAFVLFGCDRVRVPDLVMALAAGALVALPQVQLSDGVRQTLRADWLKLSPLPEIVALPGTGALIVLAGFALSAALRRTGMAWLSLACGLAFYSASAFSASMQYSAERRDCAPAVRQMQSIVDAITRIAGTGFNGAHTAFWISDSVSITWAPGCEPVTGATYGTNLTFAAMLQRRNPTPGPISDVELTPYQNGELRALVALTTQSAFEREFGALKERAAALQSPLDVQVVRQDTYQPGVGEPLIVATISFTP
jgi:hypothetical protein